MKLSWKSGLSFGLASGIITTLGLMTGLYSSTNSKLVVISGIFIIALADSLSDATGMHISKESDIRSSTKAIWEATFATFLAKLFFTLSFVIPFLILSMQNAIIVCFIWGGLLLTAYSIYLAKIEKISYYSVVLEHLAIATFVVIATYYLGQAIPIWFNI